MKVNNNDDISQNVIKMDDEKIVKAKFYIPKEDKTKYIRLKIAPSKIENAGLGVYAVDDIPKDARGMYKGVKKSLDKGNVYYSWLIYEYDLVSGTPNRDKEREKELFLIDASSKSKSNWTRYVNCGMHKKDNNLDSEQCFDKIYYYTTKKINSGDELFIDYGIGYRKNNLKMKGRYG
jgi:hypothetical protein